MKKIKTPPLKTQGIKTKIVPLIQEVINERSVKRWVEPFLGSGVVAMNIRAEEYYLSDNNPYSIDLYTQLQSGSISSDLIRKRLEEEALNFSTNDRYYYYLRDRFNAEGNALDYLILNRTCFNGVVRFNKKGQFNTPFCNKPDKLQPAFITKIVNQAKNMETFLQSNSVTLSCGDYTCSEKDCVGDETFLYIDPPYLGRSTTYYTEWGDREEKSLFDWLLRINCDFILSSWKESKTRKNESAVFWSPYKVITIEHEYLCRNSAERSAVQEALVMNF